MSAHLNDTDALIALQVALRSLHLLLPSLPFAPVKVTGRFLLGQSCLDFSTLDLINPSWF